ncbi:MAG: hypothetical protein AB1743_02620 [Actinomycetota bacterium]
MPNLINELRMEHLDLSVSFGNLKHLVAAPESGWRELQSVKAAILAHVGKENQELYPKLREAAFNNLRLQRILDWFTRENARISAALVEFLDKYSKGGSPFAFRRDFNRLDTIFNALIRQEEAVLFNEYLDISLDTVA